MEIIKAIGELNFIDKNTIDVGGMKFVVDKYVCSDLKIARCDYVKEYKWLKTGDFRACIDYGLYFSISDGFVSSRIFSVWSNEYLFLLERKERGSVHKNDVFFALGDNNKIYYIGNGVIHEVNSFSCFARTARVFGIKKSCVDKELWNKVKDLYEGSVFAILDKKCKRYIRALCDELIVWGYNKEIVVEGGSEEHINDVLNRVVIVNEI